MTENATTYAVIRTGGKQYRVVPGQRVRVEKVGTKRGRRYFVSGRSSFKRRRQAGSGPPNGFRSGDRKSVAAVPGQKGFGVQKRRKKGYKKLQGHRQNLTEVLIEKVGA
jgi:large subunit ribosomal protein L21